MSEPHESGQQLAQLEASGADHFDPVRFGFLRSLAGRLEGRGPRVRRALQRRLDRAIERYRDDYQQSQAKATADTVARNSSRERLQPLTELIEQLEQSEEAAPDSAQTPLHQRLQQQERSASAALGSAHCERELGAIREFRESWSRLRSVQLVEESVNQGPENAGPLNPERLAIRSLSVLRELSPEYLHRFVSYVDTLLWLQQIDNNQRAPRRGSKRRRQS